MSDIPKSRGRGSSLLRNLVRSEQSQVGVPAPIGVIGSGGSHASILNGASSAVGASSAAEAAAASTSLSTVASGEPIRPGAGRGMRLLATRSRVVEPGFGLASLTLEPGADNGGRGVSSILRSANVPPPSGSVGSSVCASASGQNGHSSSSVSPALNGSDAGTRASGVAPMNDAAVTRSRFFRGPARPDCPIAPMEAVGPLAGRSVRAVGNYFPISVEKDFGIFYYRVEFKPDVDDVRRKKFLVRNIEALGRVKLFDEGTSLYLPRRLSNDCNSFMVSSEDGQPYAVKVIYVREETRMSCLSFYNKLFNKILRTMNLTRTGRFHFDYSEGQTKKLQEQALRISPGFQTSIDVREGGLMLCIDVCFKVANQTTVLDRMNEIAAGMLKRNGPSEQIHQKVYEELLNQVVMTTYRDKTYKIDDIDFAANPTDFFETPNERFTYEDYYKTHYGITIKNLKQPLLVSRVKSRIAGKKEDLRLVPELCRITGMSDSLRKNHCVMKVISSFTKPTPEERAGKVRDFIRAINGKDETRKILEDWGLRLDDTLQAVDARILPAVEITVGGGCSIRAEKDWMKDLTGKGVFKPVPLKSWLVVCPLSSLHPARSFVIALKTCGRQMGIMVSDPVIAPVNPPRGPRAMLSAVEYVGVIRNEINMRKYQHVVFVMETRREDIYQAIKNVLTPVQLSSQCVLKKTITSPKAGIAAKVMIQINTKLGGQPWEFKVPQVPGVGNEGVMFVGVDVYHERNRDSVTAMVASVTKEVSTFKTKLARYRQNQELNSSISAFMEEMLHAWFEVNRGLPSKIVVHRDGVGEGQLDMLDKYEAGAIESTARRVGGEKGIGLCFIMVSKRINTRVFLSERRQQREAMMNPPGGTIVDKSVTRRRFKNFYLVPQWTSQGTVSPIHCVIVRDNSRLPDAFIQYTTYSLCHMYFNWTGTISVPATIQYSHKAAQFGGQVLKDIPKDLGNTLFYL